MPSPKARPTNLRLLEGSRPGRDSGGRVVKPTPGFVRLPPAPPAWLGQLAREVWDEVVAELSRLQLLKPIDGPSLAVYCDAWQRYCDAREVVSRCGSTYENQLGNPVKRPEVLILEAASKEIRAWAGEFGVTPSAESRLGKTETPDGHRPSPFAS